MSKFAERAREIRENAAAERKNFDPGKYPNASRRYNYWLEHGGEAPIRENWCHFWRVAAIWAPLRKYEVEVLSQWWGKVLTAAVYVALVMLAGWLLGGLVPMAIIFLGLPWLVLAGFTAERLFQKDRPWWVWALAALTFPVSFLLWGGAEVVTRVPKKAWTVIGKIVAGVWFAALAGLLVWVIALTVMEEGWLPVLLWSLASVCFLGVLIAAFAGLEYLTARQREKREAERAARSEAIWNAVQNNEPVPWTEPKRPNAIKRFFTGVAEFLVMMWQVVVTSKWKICPLIEVPKDQDL
jgi:hypothetical protein